MMRVSRFLPNYPNFEFFLLRIHDVNELEGPIDDSKKKVNLLPTLIEALDLSAGPITPLMAMNNCIKLKLIVGC